MVDIEVSDMIFGMNFFGKQNFEIMTLTRYNNPDMMIDNVPEFVRYEMENPKTSDVYMIVQMDKFVDRKESLRGTTLDASAFSNVKVSIVDEKLEIYGNEAPNVFRHIQETYGNAFRLDIEEVIMWLQDNRWPSNYNGIDLQELR